MKSLIMYYYNLNKIETNDKNNKIKFKDEIYELIKVNNDKEIYFQYNLSKNRNEYDQIILNKDNNIITKYKDSNYILLKRKEITKDILNKIINTKKLYYIEKDYVIWPKLWSYKCDYIEEHYNTIRGRYCLIDDTIDYYIGMTETAINYYSYNINNEIINELYLVHKRISYEEFNNPINIYIDIKERDYAEYLKMIFITKEYLNIDLNHVLNKFNLTRESSIKIISRLLYPSYYYDIYEHIVLNKELEDRLKDIIKRVEEYENYIKKIHTLISQSIDLPNIDWL